MRLSFLNKSRSLFFFSFVISTILIHAFAIASDLDYLTEQSQKIHTQFWSADSLIYGHVMLNTKYQTPIFQFKGKTEGPAVLIVGGTHGNEPAGFEAAHRLLRDLLEKGFEKGTVFIIPEANKIAVQNNSRRIPVPENTDRERGNLNRCYPGDPDGLPMEKAAYQINQLMKEKKVELLLDLHESPYFHLETKNKKDEYHGLGQTLIYTLNEEATWLGMIVLDHMNSQITEEIKKFTLLDRPIENSTAWMAGKYFNIPGFTVETCKKLPLEKRIKYQLEIVKVILKEKGILSN